MVTMPVDKGFVVTSGFGPRWGTVHYGTDFGLAGGCGGKPIYAVKEGTVTAAGPATGFGRWINLDHDASVCGGLSVYGHIIPEVTVGQKVKESQQIGRIDPNSATNGGVSPHLHFEWHRYVWSPPGPDRLDPMKTVLVGAGWPGQTPSNLGTKPETSQVAALFGIDVSEHQKNLSLKRAVEQDGMAFVILRLCDGTHVDSLFTSHLADAERTDALVSTYWYLRAPSEGTTISQQVDVIDRQMNGRRDLGVWIDVESVDKDGAYTLTGDDVWTAKRELESRGYHVPGIYTGRWYWEHMPGGEPSMDGLGHLWASNYGDIDRTGSATAIYDASGGTNHPGWSYPLGDRTSDILQTGSRGIVAGHQPVDVNAYRGTRTELARIFHAATTLEEDIMTILSGVSAQALNDTKLAATEARDILKEPIGSLINGDKEFQASSVLALIDRAGWENRELLFELFRQLGLDPHATIDAAISRDNKKEQ